MPNQENLPEYPESHVSAQVLLFFLIAYGVGTLAAMILLPAWLPQLVASLIGPDPKAFWFLSRGSAFVALSLLWLSMALGLLLTNKMARFWPGTPAAYTIHEFASLLGLGFALFHVLILLGDRFINYDLAQLLIPFAGSYMPFWVGIGQLGFYSLIIVTFTFYVRRAIGQKTWRVIHYVSFLSYFMALVHGLAAGTDSTLPWVNYYYWITGGSLLFLFIYRIVGSLSTSPAPKPAHPSKPVHSPMTVKNYRVLR